MGNYENLKQSITEVIRTNGNQEITGAVLQSTLLTIISSVGANATFAGIATPTTNPGTPDGPVFYLASESGTYTNFNAIELQDGLSVLLWNGSWSSQQMFSIDDVPTAGSDNLVKSGGVKGELDYILSGFDANVLAKHELNTTIVEDYYFDKNNSFTQENGFGYKYAYVEKGKTVYSEAGYNAISLGGIGLFRNEPTYNTVADIVYPCEKKYFIMPFNGYVVVSNGMNYINSNYCSISLCYNAKSLPKQLDDISVSTTEYLSNPINKIKGYYLNPNGGMTANSAFYILVYDISKSSDVIVSGTKAGSTDLCEYVLSNEIDLSSIVSAISTGQSSFPETHIDTQGCRYIAITGTDWQGVTYKLSVRVLTTYRKLRIDEYKVLFIGDSISTWNNYKWKGYLEQYKNIQYVRDTGNLWPANAGISFACVDSKEELNVNDDITAGPSDTKHSIWYRCAYGRMKVYEFDKIFLFGGTNDANCIAHPNQWIVGYTDIGTTNDIPFVDDAATITSEPVTDVYVNTMTMAQYVMGCILMLKRDFPNKEIVMATIYPTNIVNVEYKETNHFIGDEVTKLQINIANKYGLRIVPWYWEFEAKNENSWEVYTIDGVHPNEVLAWQMMQKVSACMCLENRNIE